MNIEEIVLVMARQYGFNPEIKCDLQKKQKPVKRFIESTSIYKDLKIKNLIPTNKICYHFKSYLRYFLN